MASTTMERNILSEVKKVAGLLRISTEKTDSTTGKKVDIEKTLKNHKHKMLEYCNAQNWDVQTYEEVLSGSTVFEKRPELQALLNDIANYDAIVVMELPRLARQGTVSEKIKEKVIENGTLIITLNPVQVYDLARNSNDALMYSFGSMLAEHERRVVSARVKQNKISMAKQGLNSSGSVPFGYKRNPSTKKLEIIEEQALIVKQIFQWYLEGMGQRTICDRLNDMGIKNKQGNQWIPNSLRVLLTTETYKGTLIANSYDKIKGKYVASETVKVENNHPAIIDPETFDKAMQLRNNKKERLKGRGTGKDWNSKKHMSMLDGLLFCSQCGRKSTIKYYSGNGKRKPNFHIIKCTRFDANGKTCNNGGCGVKDIQKLVLDDVLKEKEKIETKISNFSSNDFGIRLTELEDQKNMLEKALKELEMEMKMIYKMEMKYEMEKEMKGITDEMKEEMIAESKTENDSKRLNVMQNLQDVNVKLASTPNAEDEIKNLKEKLNIIQELETREDLEVQQVNAMLKSIILRIQYKRVLPDDYVSLSKAEKENIPATIKVEYLD